MVIPVPIPIGNVKELDKQLGAQQREITDLRELVSQMQERLEKQALLLRTLYQLHLEAHDMDAAGFLKRVYAEDAAKASTPPRTCPKCAKVVNQRTNRCIYCGEVRALESALEML